MVKDASLYLGLQLGLKVITRSCKGISGRGGSTPVRSIRSRELKWIYEIRMEPNQLFVCTIFLRTDAVLWLLVPELCLFEAPPAIRNCFHVISPSLANDCR